MLGALPGTLRDDLGHARLDAEVSDGMGSEAGVHVHLKVGRHVAAEGMEDVAGVIVAWPLKGGGGTNGQTRP